MVTYSENFPKSTFVAEHQTAAQTRFSGSWTGGRGGVTSISGGCLSAR
jgi:hypothetical protein